MSKEKIVINHYLLTHTVGLESPTAKIMALLCGFNKFRARQGTSHFVTKIISLLLEIETGNQYNSIAPMLSTCKLQKEQINKTTTTAIQLF